VKAVLKVILAVLIALILRDFYLLIKGATFTLFGIVTFLGMCTISGDIYDYIKEGK
jgi:hypothetical protein